MKAPGALARWAFTWTYLVVIGALLLLDVLVGGLP